MGTDIEPSLANPRYVWSGGWGDLYLSTDYGASFNTVPSYLNSKSPQGLRGIYSHGYMEKVDDRTSGITGGSWELAAVLSLFIVPIILRILKSMT